MSLSLLVDFCGCFNSVLDLFLNVVYYKIASFETPTIKNTYKFFLFLLPMIYLVKYITKGKEYCGQLNEIAEQYCFTDCIENRDLNMSTAKRIGFQILKKMRSFVLFIGCYVYPIFRSTAFTSLRLDYICTFFPGMRGAVTNHIYFIAPPELESLRLTSEVKSFRMNNLFLQIFFQDIPLLVIKFYVRRYVCPFRTRRYYFQTSILEC